MLTTIFAAEASATVVAVPSWAATLGVVAGTVGLLVTFAMQILSALQAHWKNVRDEGAALKTEQAQNAAKKAADDAAEEARKVKAALVQTTTATNSKLDAAAKETEKVKTALIESNAAQTTKIDDTLQVVNIVHRLVNSGLRMALQTASTALNKVADMTGRPEDVKAADIARKTLADHDAKQADVDQDIAASGRTPPQTTPPRTYHDEH